MPALLDENMAGADVTVTARTTASHKDDFHLLVDDLSRTLGPSSGLTSEGVDVDLLQRCMERYASRQRDWARYAFADASRAYTRNLVDRGNGKSNLVGPHPSCAKHPH